MRRAVALLAILAAACGGASSTGRGDAVPDMELQLLDGSGTVAMGELRGVPTVINFWASWCAFCVEEMPAFEQVHQELGDRVRIVGVDRADDLDKARRLAEGTGVTYTLVADPDERFFEATATRDVMPTTVFVDAQGTIVHRYHGPVDRAQLEQLIDEHLLGG